VYGSRRLQVALLREGISVGRRRIRRLMRKLGLCAIRPKRNTSQPHPEHKIYPYLLRDKTIDQPNRVWATDITYILMRQGFLYLVAIIDWATRRCSVLASVEHPDGGVLRRCPQRSARPVRQARDLQFRQ
jgi:putative transposase